MAQATLQRVLREMDVLEVDELRQIEQAVKARLYPIGYTPEEEIVLQRMLSEGLLTEVKPRCSVRGNDRPLVHITGKALSETIIEERR